MLSREHVKCKIWSIIDIAWVTPLVAEIPFRLFSDWNEVRKWWEKFRSRKNSFSTHFHSCFSIGKSYENKWKILLEFFLKLHIIPGRIFPSIFLPFSNWEKVEKTKRKLFFKCFFLLIIFLVLSEREIAKKIYGISSEFFSSFSHLILFGKRKENNENGKYFFLIIFLVLSDWKKAKKIYGNKFFLVRNFSHHFPTSFCSEKGKKTTRMEKKNFSAFS